MDVIQQARKVAGLYPEVSAAHIALMAIVDAADAGHLIDTRRIEALRTNDYSRVTITLLAPAFYGGKRPWQVTIGSRGIYGPAQGATLADALAAAEREASRPVDGAA